jgi:hypothetical protein
MLQRDSSQERKATLELFLLNNLIMQGDRAIKPVNISRPVMGVNNNAILESNDSYVSLKKS